MGPRGARIRAIVAIAGALAIATACQEPDKNQAGAAPGPTPGATDFFSCAKSSDCVVENQKDCCPCNAGGRQIAVREKSIEAFRAARAAGCRGDLLCPQVYLCDDAATAVCLAGKCALGHVRSPAKRGPTRSDVTSPVPAR